MSDAATSDEVTRVIADFASLRRQRDELAEQSARLAASLSVSQGRAAHFEKLHREVTRERDHYMRYTTILLAKLTTAAAIVSSTLDEAKAAAYAKDEAAPKGELEGSLSTSDQEHLESLAKRLAPDASDNAKEEVK